eukprot:scaffold50378_cov70-Phaeocystis_antarctica.AAC.9
MSTSSSGRKPRSLASSLPITSTSVAAAGGVTSGCGAAATGALVGGRAPPASCPPNALASSTAPATVSAAVVPSHSAAAVWCKALCAWHLQRPSARAAAAAVAVTILPHAQRCVASKVTRRGAGDGGGGGGGGGDGEGGGGVMVVEAAVEVVARAPLQRPQSHAKPQGTSVSLAPSAKERR